MERIGLLQETFGTAERYHVTLKADEAAAGVDIGILRMGLRFRANTSQCKKFPLARVFENRRSVNGGIHDLREVCGDLGIVLEDQCDRRLVLDNPFPDGDVTEGTADAPHRVQFFVGSADLLLDIAFGYEGNTVIVLDIELGTVDTDEALDVRRNTRLLRKLLPTIRPAFQIDAEGRNCVDLPGLCWFHIVICHPSKEGWHIKNQY